MAAEPETSDDTGTITNKAAVHWCALARWYDGKPQFALNKTVIIAEDRFPNVGSMSSKNTVKRNWGLEPPTDLKGKGVIGTNAGDRPWICTWPGTLLEVFIYPSENNRFSGSPSPRCAIWASDNHYENAETAGATLPQNYED
ncbi:hypothetical protein BN1723_002062 [Verticillium longisporum]|uniref:DUF7820 domain-containing protein n=1 Tax=Verticillium longisporum TaxID=100787 RepID=A0A0G4KVN8_VERLO|nr:hypothetical protein BN1723_002062 [Verticillium longisporum]